MKESSHCGSIGSVSMADRAAASYELSEYEQFREANIERNVAASRRTGDTLGSPSSSSSSSVELLTGGWTPKRGGPKDDIPSDFDEEPTDAEVGKWSFHERLVHYLDGEKISHSIRKAVECVILIEGGTYICNLNPMKKPQMGALLLNKYQSLIEYIEDQHFSSDNVREDMLWGYKGAKKGLTGDTLWRKLEKEMTAVKTFESKFPGVNSPSQLPSGTAQLRQMKKPLIIKLWKEQNEQNPVTLYDCCLVSLLRSVLNMFFWHLGLRIFPTQTTWIPNLCGMQSHLTGGSLVRHASICLHASCTRTTRTYLLSRRSSCLVTAGKMPARLRIKLLPMSARRRRRSIQSACVSTLAMST